MNEEATCLTSQQHNELALTRVLPLLDGLTLTDARLVLEAAIGLMPSYTRLNLRSPEFRQVFEALAALRGQ